MNRRRKAIRWYVQDAWSQIIVFQKLWVVAAIICYTCRSHWGSVASSCFLGWIFHWSLKFIHPWLDKRTLSWKTKECIHLSLFVEFFVNIYSTEEKTETFYLSEDVIINNGTAYISVCPNLYSHCGLLFRDWTIKFRKTKTFRRKINRCPVKHYISTVLVSITSLTDEWVGVWTAVIIHFPTTTHSHAVLVTAIVVWFGGLPASEGALRLVRPSPRDSVQSDPNLSSAWLCLIHVSVFKAVVDHRQVFVVLPAVRLGRRPRCHVWDERIVFLALIYDCNKYKWKMTKHSLSV